MDSGASSAPPTSTTAPSVSNDEVNLAALDETLATRLGEDFQRDTAAARRVSYDEWRNRSPLERFNEWIGWILERQE